MNATVCAGIEVWSMRTRLCEFTLGLAVIASAVGLDLFCALGQPAPGESAPRSKFTLACRLANYQGCEQAAWTHLPAIGVRHVFMSVPAADQVEIVRKRLADHGLKAVVFRGDADLARPEGVDQLDGQLAVCERMGVKYLFLSAKSRDVPKALVYQRFRRAGDLAARHGVTIAIETHPDLGTNGDVLLETMRQVDHPCVRVNFDTGNIHFYNDGMDAPTELRKILPFVATVEIKDHDGGVGEWRFPALGRGRVNIAAVLQILTEHGYSGPITMEIEGVKDVSRTPQQIQEDIAQSAAYLRTLAAFE